MYLNNYINKYFIKYIFFECLIHSVIFLRNAMTYLVLFIRPQYLTHLRGCEKESIIIIKSLTS